MEIYASILSKLLKQLVERPFNTFTMNYYKYSLPLDGGGAG